MNPWIRFQTKVIQKQLRITVQYILVSSYLSKHQRAETTGLINLQNNNLKLQTINQGFWAFKVRSITIVMS